MGGWKFLVSGLEIDGVGDSSGWMLTNNSSGVLCERESHVLLLTMRYAVPDEYE